MAATAVKKATGRLSGARIDFFYDVASPYSWLAFETLLRYRKVWDAEINLRPFLLSGIMSATGNKPPATVKAKGVYMWKDLYRMAKYHDAPFVALEDTKPMFNTLRAQRLLTATSLDAPAHLEGLTRELWKRIWGGGGEIVSEQGLQEACSAAGIGSDVSRSLILKTGHEEVKEALKEVTAEALQRGAFGAPWIVLQMDGKPPESFFGCDRFDVLALALGQPWLGPHPESSRL